MQDAHHERLVGCFEQVFPDLSRSAIPASTQDTVAAWDSIAQVTLISLIGEEFGIDIDFEESPRQGSAGQDAPAGGSPDAKAEIRKRGRSFAADFSPSAVAPDPGLHLTS